MQGGREEIVGREGILGKGGWETSRSGWEEDKAVVGGLLKFYGALSLLYQKYRGHDCLLVQWADSFIGVGGNPTNLGGGWPSSRLTTKIGP